MVAGTGVRASSPSEFKDSECLIINQNDSLFICDHNNFRVQRWYVGAPNGTTVGGTGTIGGATSIGHPQYLAYDKDDNMYVTGHDHDSVYRFRVGSTTVTTVAGSGSSGSSNSQLNNPTDVIVDDSLNVYVVDEGNQRIMKWLPGASSGTAIISNSNIAGVVGISFALNSTNTFYLSDGNNNRVFLWISGQSSPNKTLSQVNSTTNSLNTPHGITCDPYDNLYVADKANNRVVRYCAGSTVGTIVVGGTGTTPTITAPMDIAFDSDLNLYVVLYGNAVIKFQRL